MEQKMLEELQGLICDINPTKIVSHILDGTLPSWLSELKMKAGMLVASLLESERIDI